MHPSSSSAPVDPAHAVDPPGPFHAPLHTADILVFRQYPLSSGMVRQIRHVPGVTRVEQFSLAQVSIQDHAINVAAVDPATYRNFNTDPIGANSTVAQFQPEWNRIAGGEMALRPSFHQQVAKNGYVELGGSSDAPKIHVGAYSPQVPQIDAVVNQSWIKTLGMREGNALLISTGMRTPASIRTALQRIVGHAASVQRLDIAARLGLDPKAVQTALLAGSAASAVGSYSYQVLGGGRIVPDPAWVASHISTETMPIIGAMTCNTQMFPQLRAALDEIVARGLAHTIHPNQYEGCYVPKFIEGTTTLSNHAFGLAFDLNVPENQRGTVGQMNRQVVAIFEKWGFTWGGTWHWTDPMHFELNRLVRPG
ncbi:MAG: M15 family metallopeptidase [Nocardioides sp.]|nr:M15 family metallopeptidase [Nocardioides sp.]